MKTKPLIDTNIYRMYCGGVTSSHPSIESAENAGRKLLTEWSNLGYRRSAKVYYRDGSLVSELGSERQ